MTRFGNRQVREMKDCLFFSFRDIFPMTLPYNCGRSRSIRRGQKWNIHSLSEEVCPLERGTSLCRRGCFLVQPSLIHNTFIRLLLIGRDGPVCSLILKRINSVIPFSPKQTKLTIWSEKKYSFLPQILNLCYHRETKRDEQKIFAYLLYVWTLTNAKTLVYNLCYYY